MFALAQPFNATPTASLQAFSYPQARRWHRVKHASGNRYRESRMLLTLGWGISIIRTLFWLREFFSILGKVFGLAGLIRLVEPNNPYNEHYRAQARLFA